MIHLAKNEPDSADSENTFSLGSQPVVTDTILADTELFIKKAFQTDPKSGYELVFKRYYRPLCSHAARFVFSKEQAEDIVADVFFTFWQKKMYLHVETSFRAYLFTSVRNQAFSYLRSEFGKGVLSDLEHLNQPDSQLNPHQDLQYNELYFKIEEVIQSVSPQSRKVFLMSRFEGKKNPLIAQELLISVKTVEGHITRVLHLLRKALRRDFLLTLLFFFDFNTLLFW